MNVLNKDQTKNILDKLKTQYNISIKPKFLFIQDKDRIFITSKEFKNLNLSLYNINNIGLYFGRLVKDKIRLTIDATQLIGKYATKNILELNSSEEWLKGKNIKANKTLKDFVIIKHKQDFLGSGKYKNNRIINFVPKYRRIKR